VIFLYIRLINIELRNFKNTAERSIDFNGRNASIYGKNYAGKSTIYDAFTWLLFDKNSLGATQFDIKPIGMERPEVSVSAVLEVDGKEVELKKVLVEKWTRRHNDQNETFTGNESTFFVNGIEKLKKDYTSFIDSIISEKDFRMLTSAEYFLSLKKPEMRAVLIKMAGGIDDMSVAGSDLELVNLVRLMQDKGYTLDDLLKLTKQNIALYNTEQQTIGTRIDEVRRGMPEEQDYSQLEAGLTTARGFIKEIDSRLSSTRTAVLEVQKKQTEASSLRLKIDKYIRQRTE
jgi:DNA repair protein SbcC/Rad50